MNLTLRTLPAFLLITLATNAGELPVAPGASLRKLAGDMKFTEGPVWIPSENKLIFSDIPASKLMQWSEKDGLTLFRESKQANGNLLDLEGRLLSCQHGARAVARTEKDGTITTLVTAFEGKRFNSPNDIAVKSDGTLWFTDPPWGLGKGTREIDGQWVFRLDPATGKLDAVIKSMAMPNGIAFSPDETRLYVADTGGHGLVVDPEMRKAPAQIHVFEIGADNGVVKELAPIDSLCDGMCIDVDGNIYATAKDGVAVFAADGTRVGLIPVPETPANACFGGADYKTLFITARKSLYAIDLTVAGAKPKGAKW